MTTTQATTTTRKPRPKPARSATLTTMTNGHLLLWLTQGEDIRGYVLTPLPSDFGTAFRLSKADNGDGHSEEYDVCLDGQHSTCECKGFLRHGHCKHTESLLALAAAGKLPTAKPQAAPEPTEFDDP